MISTRAFLSKSRILENFHAQFYHSNSPPWLQNEIIQSEIYKFWVLNKPSQNIVGKKEQLWQTFFFKIKKNKYKDSILEWISHRRFWNCWIFQIVFDRLNLSSSFQCSIFEWITKSFVPRKLSLSSRRFLRLNQLLNWIRKVYLRSP